MVAAVLMVSLSASAAEHTHPAPAKPVTVTRTIAIGASKKGGEASYVGTSTDEHDKSKQNAASVNLAANRNASQRTLPRVRPLVAAIHARLNAPLAAEYPRLAIVLRDPDAFFATMTSRFEQQKALTPSDPYQFDYSEIGTPLINDMRASLATKLGELASGKLGRSPKEREIAIGHLNLLVAEADRYLDGGVSYRSLIEFSHFYARAVGQFDKAQMSWFQRNFLKIDEVFVEGFKQHSPKQELADYKARRFSLFQPGLKRPVGFEKTVFDPHELKRVLVPTNDALSQHLLLRLSTRARINPIGVMPTPTQGDGFLRPPALFLVHDLQHEAAKDSFKNRYVEEHGLSEAQVRRLDHLMDDFYADLHDEMEAVPEAQLREAIKLRAFSFHHDLAHPLLPSLYLDHNKVDHVTAHVLYALQKIGGEEVHLKAPIRNLARADAWLRDFWQKRLPREKEFLEEAKRGE
jgi:hypothetical protein